MSTSRTYDVCVIGSGASGCVAAATLADRGLSVVIVEQGREIPRGESLGDHVDPDGWAFARSDRGWSRRGYPWSAQALGGGTIFYAGVSFRYHGRELQKPSVAGDPGTQWPFPLGTLDEHYAWVERRLKVAGPSGVRVGDYVFPDYPAAPHGPTVMGRVLSAAGDRLGLQPVATPLAIGRSCEQITPCTSYACPVGAKADSFSRFIAPSEGDITVLTESRVLRLVPGPAGRVEGAEVVMAGDNGPERTILKARRFVLAANAIQSSALLLRSAHPAEPDGMANSSGLVGRFLTMKNSVYVRGWLDDRQVATPPAPLRHRYSSVSYLDFLDDERFPEGRGGLIYEANPWATVVAPRPDTFPLQLECIVADRPSADNRVRLSNARDRHGVPRIMIDYRADPVDEKRLALLADRASEILAESGACPIVAVPTDFAEGSAHLHGTLRGGSDTAGSVTDPAGRCHDYDNLWAVDGSFFPSPGTLNPTLTIQANSRRIALAMP